MGGSSLASMILPSQKPTGPILFPHTDPDSWRCPCTMFPSMKYSHVCWQLLGEEHGERAEHGRCYNKCAPLLLEEGSIARGQRLASKQCLPAWVCVTETRVRFCMSNSSSTFDHLAPVFS